ncbi:uncharacterized protein LOC131942512 isoform X2 [Physella acuta]|uniref:uncharacterized protein LOC131942512 isoform X2 n=1 Tax=Physella acuta TaxID=109671 RepID=UPI0027DD8290|nr:uncharacterized protein LOC131942512 isoform X2 [Physella acuta]
MFRFALIILLQSLLQKSLQQNLSALAETDIKKEYWNLFKTPEEIDDGKVKEKLHFFRGIGSSSSETKSNSRVSYHGCCESTSNLVTYETLPNMLGQNVTLVSLSNRKQYFTKETCRAAENCFLGCRCVMVDEIFSALVYNPLYPKSSNEKVILTFVHTPSFCRCYNVGE